MKRRGNLRRFGTRNGWMEEMEGEKLEEEGEEEEDQYQLQKYGMD